MVQTITVDVAVVRRRRWPARPPAGLSHPGQGTPPAGTVPFAKPRATMVISRGASAMASADGSVQSVIPTMGTQGAWAVELTHAVNGRTYRTVYQNIGALAPGIAVGATVRAGQAIGVPITQTLTLGSQSVTFAR